MVMFKIRGVSAKVKLCCCRYTINPLQNFESLNIESSILITAPESVPRKSIISLKLYPTLIVSWFSFKYTILSVSMLIRASVLVKKCLNSQLISSSCGVTTVYEFIPSKAYKLKSTACRLK